jgi:hypothetical protein
VLQKTTLQRKVFDGADPAAISDLPAQQPTNGSSDNLATSKLWMVRLPADRLS